MKSYRGYISSKIQERSVPQNIQQLVIRDYCKRNNMKFLLSATEYIMDNCMMMLEAAMKEDIAGIVFYSIYLLPESEKQRQKVYDYAFTKEVHFAAEDMVIRNKSDADKLEDIFLLNKIINLEHIKT